MPNTIIIHDTSQGTANSLAPKLATWIMPVKSVTDNYNPQGLYLSPHIHSMWPTDFGIHNSVSYMAAGFTIDSSHRLGLASLLLNKAIQNFTVTDFDYGCGKTQPLACKIDSIDEAEKVRKRQSTLHKIMTTISLVTIKKPSSFIVNQHILNVELCKTSNAHRIKTTLHIKREKGHKAQTLIFCSVSVLIRIATVTMSSVSDPLPTLPFNREQIPSSDM